MRTAPARCRGFTLIELMVVIVIVGIITSLAALSVGRSGDDQLGEEVRRLAALCELASEEAIITGRQFGVHLTPQGYRFLVYREGQWQDPQDDRLLRERHLPEELDAVLRLYVDGLAVVLDEESGVQKTPSKKGSVQGQEQEQGLLAEADEGPRPQLLFLSSGEQSPAELVFAPRFERGQSYLLRIPPLGRPKWEPLDAQG